MVQTWADLNSRLTLLLRGRTDLGTRTQAWLRQAYDEICSVYRFYEFEGVNEVVVPESTSVMAMSVFNGNIKYIYDLRNNTTNKRIRLSSSRMMDKRQLTIGEPRQYTRFGGDIEFDSIFDRDYNLQMRYRLNVTEPVFTGSPRPQTPPTWDDVILFRAAKKGFHELYEPDRAEYYRMEEVRLISELPTPEFVDAEDAEVGLQPYDGSSYGGR